ncbi:zinc ribbon domain-containing protein [Enorma phocaeensis]|uniref:zinc ribbon domain-containing protein n=1 Tax=Enorma phocaeensis TaxID=1871019 RepID=UPI0032080CD9
MFCTNCGAPLTPNARFCVTCGAPIAPAPGGMGSPARSGGSPAYSNAAGAASSSAWQAPAPVPQAPATPIPAPVSQAPATPAPAPQIPTPAATSPAPAAHGSAAILPSYLQTVASRIGQTPQFIPEAGAYLLVADRRGALAVQMHSYFFFAANDLAGYAQMQVYAEACMAWARKNYEGLPRGMQSGLAVYPVMLQHPLQPDALAYVKQIPDKHWAAFELPVLFDPMTGQLEHLDKTPVWGFAMWRGIKASARMVLTGSQG